MTKKAPTSNGGYVPETRKSSGKKKKKRAAKPKKSPKNQHAQEKEWQVHLKDNRRATNFGKYGYTPIHLHTVSLL